MLEGLSLFLSCGHVFLRALPLDNECRMRVSIVFGCLQVVLGSIIAFRQFQEVDFRQIDNQVLETFEMAAA